MQPKNLPCLFSNEHDGPSGKLSEKPGNPGANGHHGNVATEEEQDLQGPML
jgi:hypothetical protein